MNKKKLVRAIALGLAISTLGAPIAKAAGTWKNGYYLENNRKASGLKRVDKYYYYFSNGEPLKSKWKTVGKSKYYFDKNGRAITGLRRLNGKLYYFNSKGAMLKSSWKTVKNKKYYFGSYGFAVTGLKKIGSGYYLFKKDGALYTNTGIINYNKKKYLLAKGKVRLGLQNYKGGLYYFTTKGMHTGWKTIKGTKFYFSPSSGRAYKGRTYTINGKKYRFSSGGQLITTTTDKPSKPDTPSTETPSTEAPSKPETPSTEKKQKYMYSIERYNPNGYGLYSKAPCVLYVKTDAPEDEFYLDYDGEGVSRPYWDVRYPKTSSGSNIVGDKIKYKDGYLVTIMFGSSGRQSVNVLEKGNTTLSYIKCEETFYFDVLDYDTYEEAYLRKVINNVTTTGMSDLEKIQKVKEYLFINYKYLDKNTATKTFCRSVKECGAYFDVQKGDCLDSTNMMIKVANILGLKWEGRERSVPQHHLWIAVYYDGQWYDVDACPNAALAKQIDPNNVEYVN